MKSLIIMSVFTIFILQIERYKLIENIINYLLAELI